MNRKTDLTARAVETRDAKEIYNIENPDQIKDNFDDVLSSIDENLKKAKMIEDPNHQKEIYRYQIVKLESAFDFLCHCIIKYGFIKIFREEWESTKKYEDFTVKFCQLKDAIDEGIDENWVLKMVDDKISAQTFMGFDDLKNGLNFIKTEILSNDIACDIYKLEKSPSRDKLKEDLSFVYDRRNKIAHQNDRDHVTGIKNDINESVVLDCKNKISNIVDSIIKVVKAIPDLD